MYESRAAVLADAASIIRDEVVTLVEEGCPYVQLDNPHYPDYIPDERRAQWAAQGVDQDRALQEDIDADNSCLRGFDRSSTILAMHVCRGNGAYGAWHTSGGYDRIAEQLFSQLEVDAFLLEYDSERAGTFAPLRFMPKGKTVVLGLVTTKAGELESQDTLLRRIDEASQYVDMDDLALSPQCGFSSTLQGNPLAWDDQLRKLELVVETARRAWGSRRAERSRGISRGRPVCANAPPEDDGPVVGIVIPSEAEESLRRRPSVRERFHREMFRLRST